MREEIREEIKKDIKEETKDIKAKTNRKKRKNKVFAMTLFLGFTCGMLITVLVFVLVGGFNQKQQNTLEAGQEPTSETASDTNEEIAEDAAGINRLTEEDIMEMNQGQVSVNIANENQEIVDSYEMESDGKVISIDPQIAEAVEAQSNISENEASERILLLKEELLSGASTQQALRHLFKEDVMVISQGAYYFFPITDDLKKHDYNPESLSFNEAGNLADYLFEDGSHAKKGVDVSKYQDVIDWEKVKADGVDFAFIRAGIRGYKSGEVVMDETFLPNAVSASEAGIEIGVYFFGQAINTEEAIEEAEAVLEALSGNQIAYPIVYDLERIGNGRMNSMSSAQMTEVVKAFCNRVSEEGYTPMIYGNLETFMVMLDMSELEDIQKWFAYYTPEMYFPYEHRIWQYSDKGRVDGISGDVDINIAFW